MNGVEQIKDGDYLIFLLFQCLCFGLVSVVLNIHHTAKLAAGPLN